MKKSILLSLILILVFATTTFAAPTVTLNGSQLQFDDTPPTIEEGRTLVPLRAIFEALGANIEWDGPTQTVTVQKGAVEIRLEIGGQAYKNGQPTPIDVPAKIINERTMVPLRFVSEALGCQVKWDGPSQTITITSATSSSSSTTQVKVHFIDVGQADSIYIQLPDHNDILIDGGNKGDGATVVNYLKSQGIDDDIELLIATHSHEDHIGGIPFILDNFKVKEIIDSGNYSDTQICKEYKAKAQAEGAIWETDNHQTFTYGDTTLQILTGTEKWKEVNDFSVVCRLDTGDIEFLFPGDAGEAAETVLSGPVDSEILKVGHHGSQTSSSQSFLSRVNSKVAVISVGTGNTYGHPTPEALQRLGDFGAVIYRTDLNGNVVVTTDGNTYSVITEK